MTADALTMFAAGEPMFTPADFFRKAREFAGLTQRELAAKLGVDVATVGEAEKNVRPIRQERIVAWAIACGVSPVWLQWNVDACGQMDMAFDLRPSEAQYTPRDSNPEPADKEPRLYLVKAA